MIHQFCPGGKVHIQAVTADGEDDYRSFPGTTASVGEGLACVVEPFLVGISPCEDFKIRYICECSDQGEY